MANPVTRIIISAVDKTRSAFSSAKNGLTELGNAATSLKGLIGSIFAGLSVVALVGQFKQVVDAMDEVGKQAQKIGTSTENFSALGYAAQQSGVTVSELEKSLIRLASALDSAKTGAGPAADAFERLRIDPNRFNDPSDALVALADQFSAMPDGINKTALAVDLFGESGANLIPLLNQGREGIAALKEEAAALGVVIGGETAAAAEQFNDNMDKLATAGRGLGVAVANDVLPGLNELTRLMAKAAKEGGVTAAAMAALKFTFSDFLTDESLSATYRLAEAQKQLNALRADGFAEDHKRVQQLKAYIPMIEVLAANERRVEESRRDASKKSADAIGANRKAEAAALKQATNDQIADAQRLQSALQTAFSASVQAEQQYATKAKELRTQAQAAPPPGDDIEAQASSRLTVVIESMKLQRIASTESAEAVHAQAEAVRGLVSNLEDAKFKQDMLNLAAMAESKAYENASIKEGERAQQQASQLKSVEEQISNLQNGLNGLGKEVAIDVKPGAQLKETEESLQRVAHLIDYIKAAGPINVTTAQGAPVSSAEEKLRTAALQYGRR